MYTGPRGQSEMTEMAKVGKRSASVSPIVRHVCPLTRSVSVIYCCVSNRASKDFSLEGRALHDSDAFQKEEVCGRPCRSGQRAPRRSVPFLQQWCASEQRPRASGTIQAGGVVGAGSPRMAKYHRMRDDSTEGAVGGAYGEGGAKSEY